MNKKLSLAKAVVNTASAVMESWNNAGGYPWGIIPAGLMLLEGAAQISAINSASYGGSASTAPVGGGGGGFGSPSLPGQATNTSVPYLPQQNQSQSQSQPVSITIQVNALDPRSVSDVDMQRIADSLSGPLQQSMNRGVNQNMVLA